MTEHDKSKSNLYLNFSRFYLIFVSLPVALLVFVITMIGVVNGTLAFFNFAFQVLNYLINDQWIPQGSPSLLLEMKDIYFTHISQILSHKISEYIKYAYSSKFIVCSLMLIALGGLIGALNYLNIFLARYNLYFLASVILMSLYYIKVIKYII